MIEQLHNDIVKQIVPPKYIYTAQVCNNSVRFNIDKSIDKSHIDVTDPLVGILVEHCVRVQVDNAANVCRITPYQGDYLNTVLGHVGDYLRNFLIRHMKQKSPRVTKLYKWVRQYLDGYSMPMGSNEEYMMLYRYLKANIDTADREVHIKNGIGILNTLKAKYEARGYKLEAGHGRRRRRRW